MNLVGRNNFYDLSNAGRPLVMLVLDPATLATPAAKLTLTSAVTAEGTPGGSFLAFARMPKFQKRCVAILDAAEHEEMVDSEYGIKRGRAKGQKLQGHRWRSCVCGRQGGRLHDERRDGRVPDRRRRQRRLLAL